MVAIKRWIILTAILFLYSIPIQAQWVTQTIVLKQGWNAVYLEIDPYPSKCEFLFKDLPINSAWLFDQHFAPVQFIQDPNELAPDNPRWRSYFPPNSPNSFASNLFGLEGGKSYLIQASQDTQLTLTGQLRFFTQKWQPDSFNLVGFHVDPQNPPSFARWFAPSSAHSNPVVFSLDSDQKWSTINPSQATIEAGRAYWVYCQGTSDYQGPVHIELPGGTELNYNRFLVEQLIKIQHLGSGAHQVQIDMMPSSPVPLAVPGESIVDLFPSAGNAPLYYFGNQVEGDRQAPAILPLPATLAFSPGANNMKAIQLVFDRTKITSIPSNNARYQGVLIIKDNAGYRRFIGVTGQGQSSNASGAGKVSSMQAGESDPFAGLWIGSVSVNKVSEPNDPQGRTTPTSLDFDFRILFHVDRRGSIRLLNEVTQLWRNGTTKPDPNDPNRSVVDQPGRYILYTPTAPATLQNEVNLGINVKPGTLRDGRPFANRISSAMFSLLDTNGRPHEPLLDITGSFGMKDSKASIILTLANTDPTNPFHHQYHPQHRYPRPGETVTEQNDWTIQRELSFTFTESSPDDRIVPGWGDIEVGGFYKEVIKGLSKNAITVEGYFFLSRASTVDVLNDGQIN